MSEVMATHTCPEEKVDQMKKKMSVLQVSQRTGFQVHKGPTQRASEVIYSSVQQLTRHLLFRSKQNEQSSFMFTRGKELRGRES